MRQRSSTVYPDLLFLLRAIWLGSVIIFCSACVRNPNTIPDGYQEIFTDDARSSTAARVDYPIVLHISPAAESINFRVTKKGERFWVWNARFWDRPFLKRANWYRLSLIAAGEPDPVCITDLTRAGDTEVMTVPCRFPITNYLSKPLVGMLDFWATGNDNNPPNEEEPALGVVDRLYYLIPNP
jgi:hypothetical protein